MSLVFDDDLRFTGQMNYQQNNQPDATSGKSENNVNQNFHSTPLTN